VAPDGGGAQEGGDDSVRRAGRGEEECGWGGPQYCEQHRDYARREVGLIGVCARVSNK
jgi:hypothetical protein